MLPTPFTMAQLISVKPVVHPRPVAENHPKTTFMGMHASWLQIAPNAPVFNQSDRLPIQRGSSHKKCCANSTQALLLERVPLILFYYVQG